MEAACGLSSLLLLLPQTVPERGRATLGTAVVPGTANIYQGGYFKDASELRQ